MKHIKKFESLLKTINYKDMTTWGSTEPVEEFKSLDIDYIKLIFGEFYDDGAKFNNYENDDQEHVKITIDDIDLNTGQSPESFADFHEQKKSFFLDIKVCVDRLKDEYPKVKVMLHEIGGYDEIGGGYHKVQYVLNIINKK